MDRVMTVLSAPDAPIARKRRMYLELVNARLSDVVIADSVSDALRAATDDQIALWHTNLRSLLGLADTLRRATGTGTLPQVTYSDVKLKTPRGADVRYEIAGAPKQMLFLQLLTLVRTVGQQKLQRCDCGRLFVRIGKRKFCQERCAKRVYMRRFRAGDVGKE
jgi:hypothetical protein